MKNLRETVKTIIREESEYQQFFRRALEKAGKSIPDMSDEEKKAFFNKIDAAWDGKGEKNEGNAFGAAVVKAKEAGDDEFEVGGKTYKVESVNEQNVYIDFLNKAKGFKKDRKVFKGSNAYDLAVKWAKKNFDNFSPDMIKFESVNENKTTITEQLVPVDKKAVDAFFDKKGFVGKNLNSDGKVLKTVGIGSQDMYIHTPKGVKFIGKVTGKYAQSLVQYVNKNHKSDLVESVNEAKSLDDLMKDANRIKKELADAQKEYNKSKTETNKAKVEAKKGQLERVANAIRNARANQRESVNENIKWQDVEEGDFANVTKINKTGVIVKAYGRKFHLMFPNGSMKTYDANELTFIKSESVNEEIKNWGTIQNVFVKFLQANTKELAKRVQAQDEDGTKGAIKSIISGLVNAQKSLKLESITESKDDNWYTKMNIENELSLYKVSQRVKNSNELKRKMLAMKNSFPDKNRINFNKVNWDKVWNDLNESITESKDNRYHQRSRQKAIIAAVVKKAKSFMGIGAELKKAGIKYVFTTSPIPMYRVRVTGIPGPGNTFNIVQKKNAAAYKKYAAWEGVVRENKKLRESINESKYKKDLDKIEAAVKNAKSFMGVGAELKKAGIKYDFTTSMIPMYMVKVPGNTIAIVNKKYAAGAEREVGDTAIGLLEGYINEGNAFGMAVTKAKQEGKKEFEFNGKMYKVKKGSYEKNEAAKKVVTENTHVVVSMGKSGYGTLMSKPVSQKEAEKLKKLTTVPRGEELKVITVIDARQLKNKLVGRELLNK